VTPWVERLAERLRPILARLDREVVTPESGLRLAPEGEGDAIEVTVEARGGTVPGLHLRADAGGCTLAFADAEILECHSDPGRAPGLADEVVALTERYLSGVAVVDHLNSRGRPVRTEYFYGVDTDADPGSKIGTSRWGLVFPWRIERTEARTLRFLLPGEEGQGRSGTTGGEE
jgi:hypothetical protein